MDSLTVTGTVQLSASAFVNRDLGAVVPFNPSIKRVFNLAFGTNPGQANQIYEKQLTLAPNTQSVVALSDVAALGSAGAPSANTVVSGGFSQTEGIVNWINDPINLQQMGLLWIENFSTVDSLLVTLGGGTGNGLLMTRNPTSTGFSKLILPPKSGFLIASEDVGWPVTVNNGWLGFSSGPTASTNVGLFLVGINTAS